MLVKKLAVPLINDKILLQTERCYIATAAISSQAFDFVRSRLPLKCKIDMVTGLDVLTSPDVLRRVWRHYQDRMVLNIYTRNFFHPNVYIFDLPYRKSVAFVGSGPFTLEGLKDHEEIFWKVTDPKEIETLKSWFTGYFEFGVPLTETILQEYELVYPAMKQREIASRQEKEQLIALTASGFNWDGIKFRNQYFKKEDYLVFGNNNVSIDTEPVRAERVGVQNKLLQLHALIKDHLSGLGVYEDADSARIVSSPDPAHHPEHKVRAMRIAYGRSKTELKAYHPQAALLDFMTLQIVIRQNDVGVWLVAGKQDGSREDREYFKDQMQDEAYRSAFFRLVTGLGMGYWIEIAGERKQVDSFPQEDTLWEFTKADQWMYYAFIIGRSYSPGDTAISNENIAPTIMKEFDKLVLLYRHIKARPK